MNNNSQFLSFPVMESFYTIQGEGFHQGKAAYFIRLGGCNVGCTWCDVKESWNADIHSKYSVEEIIGKATEEVKNKTNKKLALHSSQLIAVITGGEPLLHNLEELTNALQKAGFKTNIETSGSLPLSGTWDWICVSPKKFNPPLPAILPLANELKVVIFNQSDFAWAEQFATQVSSNCKLYLQPEWNKKNIVTPLIIDYVKAHPKWQISLQIHKYINVP